MNETGTFLPPVHRDQMAKGKVCCSAYREVRYEAVGIGTEVSFAITPASPIFEFKEGRSYIAAFGLPAGKFRRITLKTFPVNTLWNRAAHVMVPAVQLLDEEFRLLKTDSPTFQVQRPQLLGRSWAEGVVDVPDNARYAIVHEGRHSGGLSWPDRDQYGGYLHIRSGPTGELSITLRGAAP